MATDEAAASTHTSPAPKGHPIGFWFFFWGEFAERCSYYGMRAILALYMTEKLGVDKADAGTFMSLFIAACYFFPLIGGYLADNYFGKYWTIVGFSVPYVVAQFLVGTENRYVVLGALALLAMGSGVIKPNISTLMGMTYDQQRPGQNQLRTSAFNWFYMSINIGAALSQFAMPWLRTTYGYQVAFLFPAVFMALALSIFASGKRFYAVEKIGRKKLSPAEASADRTLKIQTLSQIGPVFLLAMFFWAIFDQAASTWIFFADTYMHCVLFGIPVSADMIQFFNPVFIVVMVPFSVWIFKSLDHAGWKVKATQKMTLGFLLTAIAMGIMSITGFLSGQKQDAIKVATTAGDVIVPMPATKLDAITPEAAKAGIAFGDSATLTATDWKFDKDKNKVSFTLGDLTLANGTILAIREGRIDFFQSRGLLSNGHVSTTGALESSFKPGKYAHGPDTLVIGSEAKATVEHTPPPVVEETTSVVVEKVDWVKPEERVTVWWQVFAYLIITIAEILISVTGLELAFVAAPPSMKSFVTGCWLAVVGFANLVINAPITRLYPEIAPGIYFAMLGAAMMVVAIVSFPVAARFNRAMATQENTDVSEAVTEEK